MPKKCAFGCSTNTSYHHFPHPTRNPDRFKAWVHLVGRKLETEDDYEFYRKKVVCDIHFTVKDKNRNNRLNFLAMPSLHIPGKTGGALVQGGPTPRDVGKGTEVKEETTSQVGTSEDVIVIVKLEPTLTEQGGHSPHEVGKGIEGEEEEKSSEVGTSEDVIVKLEPTYTVTELNEAGKMGAKTPEQINKVRPTVKCDVCGRKFLNVSALKSHYKFLHVLKTDGAKRKKQETRSLRKKVVPVHMLKKVNPSSALKPAKKIEVIEKSPDFAGNLTSVSKKPEFECPVCKEKFPVYFTAFRHIQKNHSVDEKGEKVPPNSPQLVKPVRIETCATCRTEIRSTEPHNCPKQQANNDQFHCMGCEQIFSGLTLFQHHVKGFHTDGAQNYFFPTRDVFNAWKSDLQEQAKIELVQLNKQKSKEIYHCSHHTTTDTPTSKLCPSTITVREFTKGIYVCYYKEHYGHNVENVPMNKYNDYSISLYTRETEDLQLEAADDNDLYFQFKKMVTCIVYDAAKVDVKTVKDLLGKALEMTNILKHYQSDGRTPLISKCLTDAQIIKTLDSLKPNHSKRKLSPVTKETKRVRKTPSTENPVQHSMISRRRSSLAVNNKSPIVPKSVTFTKIAPKKIEATPQKTLKKKTEETPKTSIVKKVIEKMPQISVEISKIDEPPQKLEKKRNEDVPQKEKIRVEEPQQKSLAKKPDVESESNSRDNSAPSTPVPRSFLQSPSSFNDQYKNFVDQNFKSLSDANTSTPRPKSNIKKKEVVKTKIGQFKVKSNVTSPKESPSKSPKVKELKEVTSKPKVVPEVPKNFKAKEIKYEVKEQENDCNILILKI